ncbi:class I SAM-dependent methyltransferase [Sediminibacterium soli]|uniref:class I SAM-dependent methyltransferase n=1 Tax=Sediminibacterium soli TaxID=2698829 RepID=UPI00137AEC14|nr:hypothetical protein [Sediminibacterium soli]NCI48158.1 hypothetical protein [Sediminibacterium soli]
MTDPTERMQLRYFNETALFVPDETLIRVEHEKQKGAFPFWARVWPSSMALAEFIAANPRFVKNKTVLELAGGLGLPSIVAAPHAGKVICSDLFPEALHFVDATIRHHRLTNTVTQLIDIHAVPSAIDPDVVLLSDVNYNRELLPVIGHLVANYLAQNKRILLTTPQRVVAKPFVADLLPYCVHQEEKDIDDQLVHVYVLENNV